MMVMMTMMATQVKTCKHVYLYQLHVTSINVVGLSGLNTLQANVKVFLQSSDVNDYIYLSDLTFSPGKVSANVVSNY